MISNALWLCKHAQNLLSPNSGHTVAHLFHPSVSTSCITRHHHRPSMATTTTSCGNGQPHAGPIYQVCFVLFFLFLSTNVIITSSSTQVHPCPPPAPIYAHPHLSPVAPSHTHQSIHPRRRPVLPPVVRSGPSEGRGQRQPNTNTKVTAIMRDVGPRNYSEFNEPLFCNEAVLWAVD